MWLERKKEDNKPQYFVQITEQSQFDKLLEDKQDFLLLKHSYRCSISTTAYNRVEKFLEKSNKTAYLVDVVAHRDLSMHIAQKTGVQHESPQWFQFQEGALQSNASHLSIYPS